MPCDCPDEPPRPTPTGGCNYLVYSGGPLANFYRLVGEAIPDVELAHGRPTVHLDGSLEFPGDPPSLAGYRQEGRRAFPVWPPCTLRLLKVQVVDGVLGLEGVCGNPAGAEHFSRAVTPAHCQDCPSRQSLAACEAIRHRPILGDSSPPDVVRRSPAV